MPVVVLDVVPQNNPSWLKLVHSSRPLISARFHGGRWDRVGGSELLAGADLDGAISPGVAHEPADRPASALLDELAHGECGGHDGRSAVFAEHHLEPVEDRAHALRVEVSVGSVVAGAR